MGAIRKGKMVIGFTVSSRSKIEIDHLAAYYGWSRSEFIGLIIEWCLDNRKTIQDALVSRVLEAVGSMLHASDTSNDGEAVSVQAVIAKTYVEQIDRFAEKMKLSRVSALETLIEIGLNENRVFDQSIGPVVKAMRDQRLGLQRKSPANDVTNELDGAL